MAQFQKVGSAYFRQDEFGQLYPVTDRDTLKGLTAGQLPYSARSNTEGLTFAAGNQSMAPSPRQTRTATPSVPNQPQETDFASLIKEKLISSLMGYKGVTNTSDLEVRRQELLRKQMLSAPYSTEGESTLTGSQKLSLLRSRGTEYEPEIKALEEQIIKARQGDEGSLSNLAKLLSISKDLGILGGEGGYQSALGKEYSDYVANERARGNDNPMTLNEYANMDANRKRAVTGDGGLSASVLAKITTIASQHDSNQIVKDYNTIQNKSGSMEQVLKLGVGGPGDLALVFEFMKALDPTSVVRETEYATAAKSGNIFAGVFAKFNGYLKEEGGFLPPQVQQAFISIMRTKLDIAQKQYDNYHGEQARKINKITGDVDGLDYITDYGKVDFGNSNTEMIRVKRNSDGATGTINASEFDSSKYTKI